MGEIATAILNVFAIIALVAVATFVIVLVSDLIISIIDGKNGIFFKRSKKETVKNLELTDEFEEQPKQIEQKVEEVKEEEKVENLGGDVDLELAEEERLALLNQKDETSGDLEERIATLEAKQEEEPAEEEHELTDDELDRMYAELIADINRQAEEEFEEEVETETEEVEEPVEEVVEEVEEPETVEEAPVETEENTEENIEDERLTSLEEEIAELRKLLEKEAEEKAELARQLEERPQVEVPVAVEGVELDTLEGLLAQKENLEERLKVASKDLKYNKKEYVPLARIKKTLENDEAKLRRREAVVAKKKIMLFGVTNYVVDAEKERELAEELDQLEALRLSVQHCKEVMEENKERYPLLESTNKILVKNVEQIKADIEVVDQKIEALKAKQGEGENE